MREDWIGSTKRRVVGNFSSKSGLCDVGELSYLSSTRPALSLVGDGG